MSNSDPGQIVDNNLHELITAIDPVGSHAPYPIEKLEAHLNNTPHLAISIFVFCENKLLLQQRAVTKYHAGGLWANTVCSHPRWQESAQACADRRLVEELGWSVPLREFGEIAYAAPVGHLFENEHVHCFVGTVASERLLADFNTDEVGAVEWLTQQQIHEKIQSNPALFTPWFRIYMAQHQHMIQSVHPGF